MGLTKPTDWPEPRPFDMANLPPFPTHALPGELRRWVEAEAEATQTPPELAGLVALAVCAACVARLMEVEPRPGLIPWTRANRARCAVRC